MTQSIEKTETTETVVMPVDTAEVSALLQTANQNATSVSFLGGGTKQELGNRAGAANLTISTAKLNKLVAYQPEDLTVTIGAGMQFDHLQEILGEHKQMLPLDPPHLPGATLGGIMATNPSGPKRLLYGTARDLLIGCEFVLADGSIGRSGGRVVKNVAGYDLHKLMIGSLGTLGLLTEVTFKVLPLPQHTEWAAALFDNVEDALIAARQAARSNTSPAALELVNKAALDKIGEISGLALPDAPYVLFFAAEGVAVAVKDQLKNLTELCRIARASEVEELAGQAENQALWHSLRDLAAAPDYNLRLRRSAALTDLSAATQRATKLAEILQIPAALQIRAGTGLIYLYAKLEEGQAGEAARLIEAARAEIQRKEGSLVIEAAPNELKASVDVWGGVGSAFASMQAIKQQLDPKGILNPDRFLKGL